MRRILTFTVPGAVVPTAASAAPVGLPDTAH